MLFRSVTPSGRRPLPRIVTGSAHLLCNAHILRSLNELCANHRHRTWARGFIELIIDTKRRADTARAAGKPALSAYQQRKIRRRWDDLADQATRTAPGWDLRDTPA